MSAKAPRKKIRWDLWMIVTVGVSIFYMLFLLYPLISMLSKSVIGEDGGFTWQYFAKVFHKKYYQRAIWGSLKISATVTLITVLLATPLAYIMSTVKIRFAGALQIHHQFPAQHIRLQARRHLRLQGLRHRYEPAALFAGVHVRLRRVQESG